MTTALERREARPTSTLILLSILMLPSVGTCGGLGACKAHSAASDFVPVSAAEIADEKKVPVGTYVELTADLRFLAKDTFPLDLETDVAAKGLQLYDVRGAESVVVVCKGSCGRVTRGHLCDADSQFRCPISEELKAYLRFQEKHGPARRALLAGDTPRGEIWEAVIGLLIAALVLGALLLVSRKILRGRRSPNVFVERSVVLRATLDAARSALLSRANTMFRLAEETPHHLVFLMGKPASTAQSVGVTEVDDVPRRLEITFQSKPYEPLRANLRVSEIYSQPGGPPQVLAGLTNSALAHSLAWVEQLLTSL